jgi:hypothetical protein
MMNYLKSFILLSLLFIAPVCAQPRLPDTEVTNARAWLIYPTTRYAHGVLGDAIEAGGFIVDGKIFKLDDNAVFEDRRVRLHTIHGKRVALLIKSYLDKGAAIALYSIGDKITPLAETPPIGTPNRWLNIIGMADFTGSGEMVIAAVITPHLRGSLRFYNSKLEELARIDGYTNHIIGERNLDLARVNTKNDIIIPTLDRRSLAILSFKGGKVEVLKNIPVKSLIRQITLLSDNKVTIIYDSGESEIVEL